MAFPDPVVFSYGAGTFDMNRTSFGTNSGSFKNEDSSATLSFSHQYGKRVRRTVRFDGRKVAPDPLMPDTNVPYSTSVYLVVDAPNAGYSNEELKVAITALAEFLTENSGANATKLLGGQA